MGCVVGIDPGTVSFDICGRVGDTVCVDRSLSTGEVGSRPELLVEILEGAAPVDLIIGPSGYGLPWVSADELGPREEDHLLLADGAGASGRSIVRGMGRILEALRSSGLPVWFAPGVIHLASVPEHRKVNRIDMGTADKLCATALAVWEQARRLSLPYAETSFVLVELGGAFTAVIAVEDGLIVDGCGGTAGALGYRALGAVDGELAYQLGGFAKATLATGGVAWIAGAPDMPPEELLARASEDVRVTLAWEALLEAVSKQVAAEVSILNAPREILLSGRLSRLPDVCRQMEERLRRHAPVRRVEGYATVAKEAAQGAALIAQGLVGGELASLVEAMDLGAAEGSVLDHLYIDEAEDVRRRHPRPELRPAPFWERS
ncbi:MAG: DUF1464 family protein [Actinobacteria bacterium]|nr:DUF1464 family protein [Actinomycetota bacterium]